MTRRLIAQIRVLRRPDLAPGAVRIEVTCRYSTTGLTSLPSEVLKLTVPMLVTSACFEHEARCGECDVSQAHEQGDQKIRADTERTWNVVQAELARRHMAGRRN